MTREGAAFALTSLAPVPLLALASLGGAGWAWAALAYLTLFAFVMDEITSLAAAGSTSGASRGTGAEPAEFPASTALSVVLGLAHFAILALVVWRFGQGLTAGHGLALFLAAGLFFGQISNANAHELIHRGGRILHALGGWVYVTLLFGHHASAHPLVHHRHVATPADPNSAPAGMGFYAFAARAWPGSFRAGLAAESARRSGQPAWRHPYALYVAGAAGTAAAAWAIGGGPGLAALLALALFAQVQLLLSDYVQHYGLRRREIDGRPEPVSQAHSWNAPHAFTGHMMLNAPRHSAHHTRPGLHYPQLGLPAPGAAPMLPWSLPVMSLIALVPPLWRRVIDPRLAYWQAEALADTTPPEGLAAPAG